MTANYHMSPDRAAGVQAGTLEVGEDPAGGSDLLDALLAALGQATAGSRTRVTMHGRPFAMITPCTRDSEPDRFSAVVYGDSYPDLIEAAEAEARGFYGPDAPLAVEHVGTIHNTIGSHAAVTRGAYSTTVTIRCTQLPEGWDVP